MERGELTEINPRSKESTLEEQLDKLCIYYMAIGVSYDDFWYGDYCALKYYEDVYLQKRKVHNEEMWMQGAYVHHSLGVSLHNAFRKTGQQPEEYMKKPIEFFPKTKEEEEAEAEAIRQRVIDNLNALKRAWDAKRSSDVRISTNSESPNTDK